MICKKHPKYEAKRKPRTPCEACWYIFARVYWYACVENFVSEGIKDFDEGGSKDRIPS